MELERKSDVPVVEQKSEAKEQKLEKLRQMESQLDEGSNATEHKSEAKEQKSESKEQKSEAKEQKSEAKEQKSEDKEQKNEGKERKSETKEQKLEKLHQMENQLDEGSDLPDEIGEGDTADVGEVPEQAAEVEEKLDQLQPKADMAPEQSEEMSRDISSPYVSKGDVPNCGELNNLEKTKQTWRDNGDGTKTYNTPEETGGKLDSNQGIPGYRGTCALASAVNVVRLADGNTDENTLVHYAAEKGYCSSGRQERENGGVKSLDVVKNLLDECKLPCYTTPQDIPALAKVVSEGRGVIICVDASKLWNEPWRGCSPHAITVTSVTKGVNGEVTGFHICDSGTCGKDAAKFYSRSKIDFAFLPEMKMCITKDVIR